MSKLNIPAGRRSLSPGHLRFFRASLDDVEPKRAWEYIELDDGDFSPTLAATTVHWIRETLVAECLSAARPELTALFRRDPARVRDAGHPSLDEFIARFPDASAFGENELIALYADEYGVSKAESRRARLQARLRDAFDILARAIRKQPHAADAIAQWLAPHLVGHLHAVGLRTLGDVRTALDKRRTQRWDEVPGIGEQWAARLTRWLEQHVIVVPASRVSAVRPAVSGLSGLAGVADASDLTPVCVMPAAITPIFALYPTNRIGAHGDADAIERWLDAKAPDNQHTRKAYKRIAERMLLWCTLERRRTFPQLTGEDCSHYRAWLTDLGRKTPEEWAAAHWRLPAQAWLGRRGPARNSLEWRPFEGALSKASISQDLTVLRSLFGYLAQANVTDGNPFTLMGKAHFKKSFANSTQMLERGLTKKQRDYLLAGTHLNPDDEVETRLHLILWLGFGCGLRSAEMLSLTMSSIVMEDEKWRLRVIGKGDKMRKVPLSKPVLAALFLYMRAIGLGVAAIIHASSGLDADAAAQPILRTQRGRRARGADGARVASTPTRPMQYRTLYEILKKHLEAKSLAIEADDPVSAARLRKASNHWLRHTCAVLSLKAGVNLPGVQKLLGHASIATTGLYLTEDDDALAEAMEAALASA